MYKLEKLSWRLDVFLSWLALSILITACASTKGSTSNSPMVIKEQGSFAVGGTVVTAPGTFDPIKHGAFNPAAH